MRFVQFCIDGKQCIGLENGNGGGIVNLSAADASFPTDMRSFIEGGEAVWKKAENYKSATPICRDHVQLLAPITSCDKVLCVGMNYKDHCEEQNAPVPVQPCLDWEEADAMSHVFGYTIANDLSARDWQLEPGRNGGQWLIGKAMHQFCPLGPAIVTPGELGDPHKLGLRCRVNGVVKQDSNTDQLVHKTEQILAFISRFMCLKPGDLILTGTPPGTGDVVEVEVDGIGTVTTTIV
ncbi:FAHD2-like protein [Mya arenaria]|uniref:FAHD2-like protein n=1 Tax=Mya arenaria TaxID=6604 RepID=A0ABY7FK65_MYAAR|nr:FAHD2-like protein [Mya arenaria]